LVSGVRDGRGRGGLLPAVVAVVALAAAGVLWNGAAPPDHGAAGAPASSARAAASATLTEADETTSGSRGAGRPVARRGAGVPRRVVVESLGIDAAVVPVQLEGTSLDPPADPQLLGWWSGGARVGAARGTALVTGHTVHQGDGAMDDLDQLGTGAEIEVRTSRGMLRYVAESVQVLDKDALARRAPQLFDQDVGGRLVLVTCEDWDGAVYRSNVVVIATPTSTATS
jgi:LPXTG-site transpeptidase (sortase) family protein